MVEWRYDGVFQQAARTADFEQFRGMQVFLPAIGPAPLDS